MQKLKRYHLRAKLVKYIFLSASVCVILLAVITIYINKIPLETDDIEINKKDFSKKLPKDFKLNINKSVFEGVSQDLLPYKIMAQNVIKNASDKYLLNIVSGTYTIPSGTITIKSNKATLDEISKSVILENNVIILFDEMNFNGNKFTIDLDTKDAKSEDEVTVLYKKSKIRADKFQTENSSKIIHFDGNVDSQLDLSDF